jgi:hypothetical protein
VKLTRFSKEELERIGGDGIRRRRWEIPTAVAAALLLIAGLVFDANALQTIGVLLLPIALLTNAIDAIRTGVARVRVNFYLARWRHPLLFWFHVALVTMSGVVLLLVGVQSLLTGKPLPLPRMMF